jgi:hypothetical protein
MSVHYVVCAALFAVLGRAIHAADVIAFTIPSTTLSNASQIMDPRFAGFGIEFSNIFSYTGTAASPNTFSSNLINNLKSVAGVAPCFRIGGNTQDNAIYQSSFTGAIIGRNTNPTTKDVTGYVPFDNDIYGPELFKALGTFPAGTQFIFGLNLAYNNPDYIDKITGAAKAALEALNGNLYSFEIGNEPDLYASTAPYRIGEGWDGSSYVSEWTTRASAIQSQVPVPPIRIASAFPVVVIGVDGRSFHRLGDRTIPLKQVQQHRPLAQHSRSKCFHLTILTGPMLSSITINTITFITSKFLDSQSLVNI